jgi:hypothetical protein
MSALKRRLTNMPKAKSTAKKPASPKPAPDVFREILKELRAVKSLLKKLVDASEPKPQPGGPSLRSLL